MLPFSCLFSITLIWLRFVDACHAYAAAAFHYAADTLLSLRFTRFFAFFTFIDIFRRYAIAAAAMMLAYTSAICYAPHFSCCQRYAAFYCALFAFSCLTPHIIDDAVLC